VPPAHLIKQAHLTARARQEAERSGIIAMPEAEYQRKLETVWKTAREDLIGSLPAAQLLALEARISMACVEKIVTAVSGLRTAELQVEFIRLRAEYLRKPSMPVPPALPVPLDTLAAEVTTSFDEAGDDHEWPAEYSQVLTAKQAEVAAAAVDMDVEEAGANASYNRSLGRLREETAAILEAHRYPPAVEAGRSQRRGTGRNYSRMNSGL
jgi:hypothetical protein